MMTLSVTTTTFAFAVAAPTFSSALNGTISWIVNDQHDSILFHKRLSHARHDTIWFDFILCEGARLPKKVFAFALYCHFIINKWI